MIAQLGGTEVLMGGLDILGEAEELLKNTVFFKQPCKGATFEAHKQP